MDLFEQGAFELFGSDVSLRNQVLAQCARVCPLAARRRLCSVSARASALWRRFAAQNKEIAQKHRSSHAPESFLIFQRHFEVGVAHGAECTQNDANRL